MNRNLNYDKNESEQYFQGNLFFGHTYTEYQKRGILAVIFGHMYTKYQKRVY